MLGLWRRRLDIAGVARTHSSQNNALPVLYLKSPQSEPHGRRYIDERTAPTWGHKFCWCQSSATRSARLCFAGEQIVRCLVASSGAIVNFDVQGFAERVHRVEDRL